MLVCLKCGNKHPHGHVYIGNQYGEKIPFCRKESCRDENDKTTVVDIDDLLVDIIIELNKHFETIHCCEGHFVGKNNDLFVGNEGYITFNQIEVGEVWAKLDKIIPDFIGDFAFTGEDSTGYKSAMELIIVNKFILRWIYNPEKIVADGFEYNLAKLNLLKELHKIFKENL